MRFLFSTILIFSLSTSVFGQKKLDKTLKDLNSESVPYIYVDQAISNDSVLILDTRTIKEFEVSHIKNAVWVGYDSFNLETVSQTYSNKQSEILVYCSIGVRSEDIGEQLQKAGYSNVKNLYGGIFEWKNSGKEVYNSNQVVTDSVHTYDKEWGKLLNKGIKVH